MLGAFREFFDLRQFPELPAEEYMRVPFGTRPIRSSIPFTELMPIA